MASSKIHKKAPIPVPNRSGFDLSHFNLSTLKCGTITPIFVRDCLPNETISLGINQTVNLPPMATDFYGSVHIAFESFFVPYRILLGNWQEIVTSTEGLDIQGFQPDKYLPHLEINYDLVERKYRENVGAGSLSDYLGMKIEQNPLLPEDARPILYIPNPIRYLAYHKIINDWYIDTRLQKPLFFRPNTRQTQNLPFLPAAHVPYLKNFYPDASTLINPTLGDGSSLFDLRQRLWPKDYFTNATTKPQAGDAVSLEFDIDSSSETGSFTIRSLRAANALQQWRERNSIAGNRYSDQIYARFGVYPSDAVTDRAIFINNQNVNIYNKSVFQTQNGADPNSRNPFSSVGAKYGSPMSIGNFGLIDDYHTSEHGVLMVMATVVPIPLYSSGTHRQFSYSNIMDFPDPMLQAIGDQEIYQSELKDTVQTFGPDSGTFAYTQRYSEAKFMNDEVHGLLRDGQSLSAFALQRSISGNAIVQINSEFIEIPQDYLDQVTAVNASVSEYGAWGEFGIDCKLVSPLQPYTIPTLGDPKDTHTEIIDVGGKTIR